MKVGMQDRLLRGNMDLANVTLVSYRSLMYRVV